MKVFLTTLIFLISPIVATAAPPLVLESGTDVSVLGQYVDILKDPKGQWSLDDVVARSDQFTPSSG